MGKAIVAGGARTTVPVTGTPLGNLAVGSIVTLHENDTPVEYIVINQGIPSNSSSYDSSCEGTWLLKKYCNIFDEEMPQQWKTYGSNDYETSLFHQYLNETYIERLDVKNIIKQVKIPYHKGGGYSGQSKNGADGLSVKIFILSSAELGLDVPYTPVNGARVSYFDGTASKLIYTTESGTAVSWWQRSPKTNDDDSAFCVTSSGGYEATSTHYWCAIRPALILPSDAKLLNDGTIKC